MSVVARCGLPLAPQSYNLSSYQKLLIFIDKWSPMTYRKHPAWEADCRDFSANSGPRVTGNALLPHSPPKKCDHFTTLDLSLPQSRTQLSTGGPNREDQHINSFPCPICLSFFWRQQTCLLLLKSGSLCLPSWVSGGKIISAPNIKAY